MRHFLIASMTIVVAYWLVAYLFLPWVWRWYEHRHPWTSSSPTVTQTKDGVPGDPINVSFVGAEKELDEALKATGWMSADPLGVKSDLRIAADTVLERPYPEAPVSDLYLFGRREDLAFEQPVGSDPRRRHHVRFWRSPSVEGDGRAVWLGAVTLDVRVGISSRTGQITHHISAEVDAERDRLMNALQQANLLETVDTIEDFHPIRQGKNGGGDPWVTDGRLLVGILKSNSPSPRD